MPEIPGSVITAYCKKCEADTSHTVLEVVEGGKRLGKVRCDKCRDEHPFRRPKVAAPKKPKEPKASRPKRSSKSKAPQEVSAQEAWHQVETMVQAAAKVPYEMSRSYEKGEVIEHAQFGVGVVVNVLSPTKVEVLFPTTRRKLVCGQPE
jgi:ribosomal protein L44E